MIEKRRHQALLVLSLALVVRLVFLAAFALPVHWSDAGVANGSELGSIARNLAEGRGFSSPFGPGDRPTAWIAPVVPAVWALWFAALGVFSQASLYAVLGLQVLASALSCVVIWWILDRTMRRKLGCPPRMVVLIAAAFCFWPDSLLAMKRPWYFPLQEFGSLLMIRSGMLWWDRPDTTRSVSLGLHGGLLCLVNPAPMPVLPWILGARWITQPQRTRTLRGALVVGAVAFTSVLPWVVRNHQQLGAAVFVRANFGVELLQGNHPDATIQQTRDSLHPALRREERARYEALGEAAYARECRDRAVAAMREHPGLLLRRTVQRVIAYWLPVTTTSASWQDGTGTPVLKTGIRWIVALLPWVLVGVLGFLRRGVAIPDRWLLLGPILLLPLPYYITHVNPSYTALSRPFVLLLAAVLFGCWLRRREAREPRPAAELHASSSPAAPSGPSS
jgi:hypothetical protein